MRRVNKGADFANQPAEFSEGTQDLHLLVLLPLYTALGRIGLALSAGTLDEQTDNAAEVGRPAKLACAKWMLDEYANRFRAWGGEGLPGSLKW